MVIPPFKKYRNKFEYILYTKAAYKNGFLIAPWLLPSHFHSHFHPQTIILKAIHQSLHQPVSRKQRPQALYPDLFSYSKPTQLNRKKSPRIFIPELHSCKWILIWGPRPRQKVYLETEQHLTLWHLDNLYGKPEETSLDNWRKIQVKSWNASCKQRERKISKCKR